MPQKLIQPNQLDASVTDPYLPLAGGTMTGGLITTNIGVIASVGSMSATSQSANTFSSGLDVRKRGTTGDANAAVTSSSEIGYHSFSSWQGAAFKRLAYVIVRADGDTTSTTGGGYYTINTRSVAGVEANRLTVNESATFPSVNLVYTSGAVNNYWLNTYSQTLNLNSTASITGATAGILSVTGDLRIVTAGTDTTSVATLGGAQTLTSKTLTTPTVTTLTLKDATDTTKVAIFAVGSATATTRTITIPDSTGTLVLTGNTGTLTNKRITPRIVTTASTATLTIASDSTDQYTVTAQAVALSIANPTGTPTEGQKLMIRLEDNGTAQAITWGALFRAMGTTLPTTTVATKTTYVGCIYNLTDLVWDVVAVVVQA